MLARRFSRVAIAAAAIGCNALTGVSDLSTVDDAGAPPVTIDRDAGADVAPAPLTGFRYRRALALVSDAPATLVDEPVLVVLPRGFDAGHAQATGADLRFRMVGGSSDLPHYVEAWPDEGDKLVWVKVPSVPQGASTIHLLYGNAAASAISSFEATFPRALRTAGGGAGNVTATDDLDLDWFELRAGDTLTLPASKLLQIKARRVIVAGNVDGVGRGFAGGAGGLGGQGPGGGQALAGSGAGGGGHGGSGGAGGADQGAGGAAGPVVGTPTGDDIAMGSGGGASPNRAGGAGGGAISIVAWRATVSGAIRVNGTAGIGGANGQCGGGGSGGGILVAARDLDMTAAALEANGGEAGPPLNAAADGGGGGGGGRIKVRRRASGSYVAPATMTVAFGTASAGLGPRGAPGNAGTVDVDSSSMLAKGVEVSLGEEEKVE
ncbi:MAG: DUF2341 domain-containing protein [Labilithrix sp.]|nr:DUF2341 domain-containing protein [Labilithrix sp.]